MLNEEEIADQFFAAREHVVRQGELVTYLLSRYQPVMAHEAIQATLASIALWHHRPWDETQLIIAYQDSRNETRRKYDEALRSSI